MRSARSNHDLHFLEWQNAGGVQHVRIDLQRGCAGVRHARIMDDSMDKRSNHSM